MSGRENPEEIDVVWARTVAALRSDPRVHRWCWTFNNYTRRHVTWIKSLQDNNSVTFLIFGKEVAPTTGTPHLQGYIETESRSRLLTIQRLLSPKKPELVSARVCKGTAAQNIEYCSKGDDVFTFGTVKPDKQQGKRSDLKDCMVAIKGGMTSRQAFNRFPTQAIMYGKGLERYRESLRDTDRRKPAQLVVIWGNTGTGKSRWIQEEVGRTDVFWYSPSKGNWWDGYLHHNVVILDDITDRTFDVDYFKRLLDRFPVRVEVKCSTLRFNCERIYITTNHDPSLWYKPDEGLMHLDHHLWESRMRDYDAVQRRLVTEAKVFHFTAGGTLPIHGITVKVEVIEPINVDDDDSEDADGALHLDWPHIHDSPLRWLDTDEPVLQDWEEPVYGSDGEIKGRRFAPKKPSGRKTPQKRLQRKRPRSVDSEGQQQLFAQGNANGPINVDSDDDEVQPWTAKDIDSDDDDDDDDEPGHKRRRPAKAVTRNLDPGKAVRRFLDISAHCVQVHEGSDNEEPSFNSDDFYEDMMK